MNSRSPSSRVVSGRNKRSNSMPHSGANMQTSNLLSILPVIQTSSSISIQARDHGHTSALIVDGIVLRINHQ